MVLKTTQHRRDYLKAWRKARWDRGLCMSCPKPREDDFIFCSSCRAKERARVAKFRDKKRSIDRRLIKSQKELEKLKEQAQ